MRAIIVLGMAIALFAPVWAAAEPVLLSSSGAWSAVGDIVGPPKTCAVQTVVGAAHITISAGSDRAGVMQLIITKPDWTIKGTTVPIELSFSDGGKLTLIGSGQDQEIKADILSVEVKAFIHHLTASTTATLTLPQGHEQPWQIDLTGTSQTIGSMAQCVQASLISLPPPFQLTSTDGPQSLVSQQAKAADRSHDEARCSYSNGQTHLNLSGPCKLTETKLNGHFGYLMSIEGHTVSIEYVQSSGADHLWKIDGEDAHGFEIDRTHLHGATNDLNQSIEWQDPTGTPAVNSVPQEAPQAAEPQTSQRQQPTSSDCKLDWRKCRDNEDLVNNYSDWSMVRAACQVEATDRAQYGNPVWPGFWSGGAFGSFRPGSDYVSEGVAIAIESKAQFQNGFGAMVHSTVVCKYDLRSKKVLNVVIYPN